MFALIDWKNSFLCINDIKMDNFTKHLHLYKQPPSRSVKALKKKRDKADNNVIIIWKRFFVDDWILWVHMYLLSWRKTSFFCIYRYLTKKDVRIDKCKLPTFYWLPKINKSPNKSCFISNSSHSSAAILSKYITSALTAVKDHVIKYGETAFSNSNVNYFGR